MLIDVATSAGKNVMQKRSRKGAKIQEFYVQRHKECGTRNVCMVISVIIGATGIVTRSLKKNLEALPGRHSVDSLQETTTLGTSNTTRKVLQSET